MKKIKGILTAISAFCMLAIAKTSLAIVSDVGEGGGIKAHSVKTVVDSIIKQALIVLGGIAVLVIIYGGFLILFGGQDEANLKKGKTMITYAVVGIIVIALAAAIVSFALGVIA